MNVCDSMPNDKRERHKSVSDLIANKMSEVKQKKKKLNHFSIL